jgi:membrane protein
MQSTTAKPAHAPAADRGHDADSPWKMPLAGWKDVALRTWRESAKDNVGIVAAGVAFYGFLALVPLLGATVLTYGMIAAPQSVINHMQSLTAVMPADIAQLIGGQLMNVVQTSGGKKGLGLLLALAIALWGARNAAGSIITALNIAYEEEEKRGFIKVTLITLAMTAVAVVIALAAVAAAAVMAYLHTFFPNAGLVALVMWKVVTYVLLAAAATAAVAALYRYGPSRDTPRWTWITPGSALAALGWLLLTLGFGFYVANFGNYNATYGSLGAVVVLLTWMYLSSYVLLFGAEMNSELEHQTARDTTAGASAPIGARGAWVADHVAGEGAEEDAPAATVRHPDQAVPAEHSEPAQPSRRRELVASRAASRAGSVAGLRKVGMVSSVLSTAGLALLRRRGRARAGAALLATAAGISLLKRD